MASTESHVLVVFGGNNGDGPLATDFAGICRLFRSDPANTVTALTTVHLDHLFATNAGPLLFGEGGPGTPRYVVWQRGDLPFFTVHNEGTLKQPVLDWLWARARAAQNGDKVTFVICCHGRHQEVQFGMDKKTLETFNANELVPILNRLSPGVTFNLINISCSSGSWVVKIRENIPPSGDINIGAHASAEDFAFTYRSASGVHRCGVFSPAMVRSLRTTGQMYSHHLQVKQRCEGYADKSTPTIALSPITLWDANPQALYTANHFGAVPQPWTLWGMLYNAVAGALAGLVHRRAPGYSTVKYAVDHLPAVSYNDSTLFSLSEDYLANKLLGVELRVLEEAVNLRRAAQLQAFFFVKEAIDMKLLKKELFDIPTDWGRINKSSRHVFNVLLKCFPKLRDSMDIITSPQLVLSWFDAPLEWLAVCLAAGTALDYESHGLPSVTTTDLLAVGHSLNWECQDERMVADMELEPLVVLPHEKQKEKGPNCRAALISPSTGSLCCRYRCCFFSWVEDDFLFGRWLFHLSRFD